MARNLSRIEKTWHEQRGRSSVPEAPVEAALPTKAPAAVTPPQTPARGPGQGKAPKADPKPMPPAAAAPDSLGKAE